MCTSSLFAKWLQNISSLVISDKILNSSEIISFEMMMKFLLIDENVNYVY